MKTLALNILDIVQNSIRAKADNILISITESAVKDIYQIVIEDNGKGIPKEIIDNVTDPFITTRTKRRFGMGLPLLKYHAELTGGKIEVKSSEGTGTRVTASFSYNHVDRQPLGDITGVLVILFTCNNGIDFIYSHKTDFGEYNFSTKETKEYLEIKELNGNALMQDIGSMINSNLSEIKASGLEIIKEVY